MKQVDWKKLLFQTTAWLLAEVLLTCLGTDDLADYSEFHFTYRDDDIAPLTSGLKLIQLWGPLG
jgi:hypothetical protein